ncbi:DUF86 domain-containing protein [uncultured Muribaculum sp.]|uniref:HepT-like ribonuclease domain-containing protein n=1 Tax=uncultured Muribaculum sp. TaxID=1918613 RepID=UPI00266FAAA1|nr:HepT-like ribonuclease domain-containing protein [uncultured Muribaculum sp.]
MKHLQDVLDAINEMQSCFVNFPNRFDLFEQDLMRRCVVERKTEIMGEAINRIRKKDPTFEIPNAKEVINTRNRIIHGYDSVETEFLWGLFAIFLNLKRTLSESLLNTKNNTIVKTIQNPIVSNLSYTAHYIELRELNIY